jgi:hypothetical protein
MASINRCPVCQTPFVIAQPAPEQIRCGACGSTTNLKKSAASSQNLRLLVSAFGAVMLVGCLGCIGLGSAFWATRGTEKKSADLDRVEDVPIAQKEADLPVDPPPPPDPRIEIVKPNVDAGVHYLKNNWNQVDRMRGGYLGLYGFTLLECDVSPDDPAIVRTLDSVRKTGPGMNQVYDLAAVLFFLNRLDADRPLNDQDRKMARSMALRIIAGQHTNGIWGYNGVILNPDQEAKLLADLEKGTYKPTQSGVTSMSNTQFAMLAVWGARKYGVSVQEPLLALAAYFHAKQNPDGSWNYPNLSLKATSTCAGLIALAIEKAILKNKEFADPNRPTVAGPKKADVNKAFAFVAQTIGRKKGSDNGGTKFGYGGTLFDADAWGDFYFLWTLERVGVIYSKEKIDGKDWYDWGYPIVMQAQRMDGSWADRHPIVIETCFALLFLKRANVARDLTRMIRGMPAD